MWRASLLPMLLAACAARCFSACPCMIHFGVCEEARQANAVFVGTVESVGPPFLDPFARANSKVSIPSAEIVRLQEDPSPEALDKLKNIYLDMFAGLPQFAQARMKEATTQTELQRAFEAAQLEGRIAIFHVSTLYRRRDGDDDDPKPAAAVNAQPQSVQDKHDKDDDDPPASLDIWTSSGDCGIDFQVGETYLVYATEDEDSGKLETSVCMRTRRLSEEKGDLAYLYFLKHSEKESTRLEGFVSSSFADQNLPRYEDTVAAPSAGAMLELDTGSGMRYARSDDDGRFFFDGLKAGDYHLSLLGAGFPRTPKTVVLSHPFHADESSCVRQIFILPKQPATPISP